MSERAAATPVLRV